MGFPQRPRQDVELSAQRVHVFTRAPTQQKERGRTQQSIERRQKSGGNWAEHSTAEGDTLIYGVRPLQSVYSSAGRAKHWNFAQLYVPSSVWLSGFIMLLSMEGDGFYSRCSSVAIATECTSHQATHTDYTTSPFG